MVWLSPCLYSCLVNTAGGLFSYVQYVCFSCGERSTLPLLSHGNVVR